MIDELLQKTYSILTTKTGIIIYILFLISIALTAYNYCGLQRAGLITYFFILLPIGLFLWLSTQSTGNIKNIIALFSSLIIIIPFILSSVIPNQSETYWYTYMLFYNKKSKTIIKNTPLIIYNTYYRHFTDNINYDDLNKEIDLINGIAPQKLPIDPQNNPLIKHYGLFEAIIIKGILNRISEKFYNHWDMKCKSTRGLSGGVMGTPYESKLKNKKIKHNNISLKEFQKNTPLDNLDETVLNLPKEMTCEIKDSYSKKFGGKIIIFQDKFISIQIRIGCTGGGTNYITQYKNILYHNDHSQNFSAMEEQPIHFMNFFIHVEKQSNSLYKYHEGMEERERFFSNLNQCIAELDWKNIEKKSKQYINELANRKILKENDDEQEFPYNPTTLIDF